MALDQPQNLNNLLALDQASKISGWAVFSNNELKDFGKFNADFDDIGDRLIFIRTKVNDLIQKYNITQVVMEDIQLQENIQTFKVLAEVFGVIYELCYELKIPVEAVLSSTWRKTLNFKSKKRDDQKREAQKYVQTKYSIKATQDESDAICIGAHYISCPEDPGFDWSD